MLAWVFAYVWTITKGGPGTRRSCSSSTSTTRACATRCPGMASAVAVMLLGVITLVFVIPHPVLGRARTPGGVRVSAAVETQDAGRPARRAGSRRRASPAAGPSRGTPSCSRAALAGALPACSSCCMTALKTQEQYLTNPLGLPWPISLRQLRRRAARRRVLHLGQEQRDPHRRLGRVARSPPRSRAFAIARMRWRGRERAALRSTSR